MDTGRKRLFKGVAYGFLGALLFIALVIVMYLMFALVEPLLSDLTERLMQSQVAERIRTYTRLLR